MQGQKPTSVAACDRLETAGSSSHDTRDKRGAKRLDQWIIAEAGQPAADERTDGGTGRESAAGFVASSRTENDAKRSRANGCEKREHVPRAATCERH